MKAQVGDELIVRGRHVGDHDRKGVIIEVIGEAGGPPYLVRWSDGHDSSFYPTTGSHPAAGRAKPSRPWGCLRQHPALSSPVQHLVILTTVTWLNVSVPVLW